jgi:arginine deiminase
MPYFFESEVLKDIPPKRMLLRTLETLRAQSNNENRPMGPVVHPNDFKEAGKCYVYENHRGDPKLKGKAASLIDFLVREGKLFEDELIYVGGKPKSKYDMEHLMGALMEQARGASNIMTIKPGLVISFRRNKKTNRELNEHGVDVKEWDDCYLDMLGGPHCSTSPLWRSAV